MVNETQAEIRKKEDVNKEKEREKATKIGRER